jgi:hypothetical protein
VRVVDSSLEEKPKTVAGRRFRREDLPVCLNLERRIKCMKRTETGLLIVAGSSVEVAVQLQIEGPAATVEVRGPEEGPASTNEEPAQKQDSEICPEGQTEGGVAP